MRGATVPRDHSQLRTSSGKETLRRCNVKLNVGDDDDVVVIDVKGSKFPDVIIIDEPEHWKKNLHGSDPSRGDQRVPSEGVISIDDEEDDDVGPSGIGRTGFGGASTSTGRSSYASVSAQKSRHPFGDDDVGLSGIGRTGFDGASTSTGRSSYASGSACQSRHLFGDDVSIGPSKRHQAYSAKVPARKHYVLNSESESGSSDSDYSDCELIDSSFDKFHELWDKAYHNRRNGAHKARYGQPSASGHYGDEHTDIGEENGTEQDQQTHDVSGPSNCMFRKEKQSSTFGAASKSTDPSNDADRARSGPEDKTESSMKNMPGPEVSNENDSFIGKEKPSPAQDGDAVPSFHKDIINDREKLKETDEYKRAIEEEWASRQQQLHIQAEEARRLKKRKKAETLRVLDMEKRQKQRVEEVRETQKKDEEHMNLKDQYRVEIRKELSSLESTCKTMPSLLRGLGIPVGGGILPTANEVHAAYKQALLKFHPDRASRMDVRQQVEAEEKFKLISRMKEKFLS